MNEEHSLFVVDTEAPWIRAFLYGMPQGVRIHGFRVRNTFCSTGGIVARLSKVGRRDRISSSWEDTWVSVPGWHKFFRLSSWLVARQVRKAVDRCGRPDAILFTLPWYASVAEDINWPGKAYYAHDTFRFYDWDRQRIVALEAHLLRNCDVGFGVAKRVVTDLEELTKTPVHYLPMATAWRPAEGNLEGDAAAGADLAGINQPIVGCVGQINSTSYDWDLVEHLSAKFPNIMFVFIGPKFKERWTPLADRMEAVLQRENIYWLGPKPHTHLSAYLRRFTVCINPLGVSEHNHRRSPLRLFDYLTTDRPIVSTAIAEAYNHLPFIDIASDKTEFARMLGEALKLKVAPNLRQRREYIAANSWATRAEEFWLRINTNVKI